MRPIRQMTSKRRGRPRLAAIEPAIRRALWNCRQRRLAGTRLLAAFAAAYPEAVFVEVGANDGWSHDPLRHHIREQRWTGVMVEPLPHLFARLEQAMAPLGGRVAVERAAIAAHDGEVLLHHPPPPTPGEPVPDWYEAIASLDRAVVAGHEPLVPGLTERLVATPVPALTFDSLRARHALDRVDLLLVDVEGADRVVLVSADLPRLRPRLVVYEHVHLSPDDRAAQRDELRALGYGVLEEHYDTYALDLTPQDGLTRRFARLRARAPAVDRP